MTAPARYRLGRSEIEVSRIALGSWRTFERLPRADAERLLGYALERGIDFLDDARYDDETGNAPIPTGYSEVLFGQLLRAVGADPAALTISNKLWWEFWPSQDAIGELEASLERMGSIVSGCCTRPHSRPGFPCRSPSSRSRPCWRPGGSARGPSSTGVQAT